MKLLISRKNLFILYLNNFIYQFSNKQSYTIHQKSILTAVHFQMQQYVNIILHKEN